jgi:hydroxymethylglutaryl-CoA lyase
MAFRPRLPQRVRLVEVGPRDGLQNESALVPTDVKVALIDRLTDAGFPAIEATSFVSKKWVPQMGDAAEVMARIRRKEGVRYPVLTPNLQGFDAALAARADEVAVFVAASETFSRKNTNCGIAESLDRARPIFDAASKHGVRVRGYISCTLGCPYEGDVDVAKVTEVADALYRMGSYEISLADTIGVGTAGKTQALIAAVTARVPVTALAAHFHDTYGQALTNVYAALETGVATFDCSVAGLGGCPYAKGATGNVASEDVVYLMNGLGIETGVDLTRLRAAGQAISDFLGRPPASRVARALAAREGREGPGGAVTDDVASPCINVCVMDAASGVCRGCLRTLDEIAAWGALDADAKRAVLAAIAERRARWALAKN